MHDLMQDWPLRVGRIIDYAARFHPRRRIVGRAAEGGIVRTDWEGVRLRALRLTQTLGRAGIGRGDVVGVMGWNTPRLLEVWYGVPGAGAALHTLNPRLPADQLVYIINHAGDRLLLVDADLAPIVAGIRDRLETVREVVVLSDAAHQPAALPDAATYEKWIAAADGDADWIAGDERDACGICYTSGTTGGPKGVAYTHRSNVLHAMMVVSPAAFGLESRDTLMPVVPLFHANGWGTAFAAPLAGAAMLLPGRDLTPAAVVEMLEMGVTVSAAVPTVWLALLAHLDANAFRLSTLDRVVIGGSSCPRAVIERFQDHYGVRVIHAWGMTETSPIGTLATFTPEVEALPPAERLAVQETVGRPPFGVDIEIVDDAGRRQPWDGETQGRLTVRGPSVVRRYLGAETDATDADDWFDTGDIATVDRNGYVRITDRAKDLIKSGGEWISSIELENAAISHPGVAEAAAVAVPHPKWGERPVLVVVARPGAAQDPEGIAGILAARFARWQLPDEILFIDELPHTATGKISKLTLRRRLAEQGFTLPAETASARR